MSTTPVTFSLFDELTQPKRAGFPVTDFLKQLIQAIGHDVCLSKRNLHSSYWTVSRARDVNDTINSLAAKADQDDSWETFDKYTGMISWLEKILLDFSLLAEKESSATKLPVAGKIHTDLAFIEIWKANRKDLRETVQQLLGSQSLQGDQTSVSAEIEATYGHDDSALLKAISQLLLGYAAKISSGYAKSSLVKIQKQIDGMQVKIAAANDKSLSDIVVVYSIQTAMIIEIVASARDPQVAARLNLRELWIKAGSLVDLVEMHVNGSRLEIETLEKAWAEFCSYLTGGITVELPETYHELRALVTKIRRPYYGQSLALVSGYMELETRFKAKKTLETLNQLNLAIEATITALTAAAQIPYTPNFVFSDNEDISTTFDTAKESVKKCLKDYEVDPATFEAKFIEARKRDIACLDLLQKRLKPMKLLDGSEKQTSLILVLEIVEQVARAPPKSTTKIYSVESTMMLSAVLWKEVSLQPLERRNRMRTKGYFQAGNETLNLETEIGKLPEREGKRRLSLMIPI
ncbi:hypothetical protein C8J56DRAFT_1032862 [Mycena floridula]|nr:hypothetical protein C8J56DRAFT_1032862 [Mycena floridula]